MANDRYIINPIKGETKFTNFCGRMMASDPCYGIDTWCTHVIENVKTGEWTAVSGMAIDPDDLERVTIYANAAEEDAKYYFCSASNNTATPEEIENFLSTDYQVTRARNYRDSYLGRVAILWAGCGVPVATQDLLQQLIDRDKPLPEGYEKVKKAHIGVDSGQAGLYDYACFADNRARNGTEKQKEVAEQFYDYVCDRTHDWKTQQYTVVPAPAKDFSPLDSGIFGAVTASGWGDGGYDLYVAKDEQGRVNRACIIYLGNYPEGDEEDEEFELDSSEDLEKELTGLGGDE